MRRLAGHQGEQQPRLLAAGELPHRRVGLADAEPEAREMGAVALDMAARIGALHEQERRYLEVELVLLVLSEIADLELGRAADRPGHGLEPSGEQLDHRRLAVAIGPEQ